MLCDSYAGNWRRRRGPRSPSSCGMTRRARWLPMPSTASRCCRWWSRQQHASVSRFCWTGTSARPRWRPSPSVWCCPTRCSGFVVFAVMQLVDLVAARDVSETPTAHLIYSVVSATALLGVLRSRPWGYGVPRTSLSRELTAFITGNYGKSGGEHEAGGRA